MKVGTDGVLLGATASPFPPFGHPFPKTHASALRAGGDSDDTRENREFRVLDIGTGTGLVALMVAQKAAPLSPDKSGTLSPKRFAKGEGINTLLIDAIDIVPEAVEQARENFENSPWAEHLHAYQSCLQEWEDGGKGKYDLIVSNPPYFVDSLKNPDKGRETARHTDTLSYEELIGHSRRLLAEDGILHLILPIEAEQEITRLAAEQGLHPTRIIYIHTTTKKAPKRFIVDFQVSTPMQTEQPCNISHLTLMGENGEPRSKAYAELCRDYYL